MSRAVSRACVMPKAKWLAVLAIACALAVASPAFGHPTAPTGLVVTNATATSVTLDWTQDYVDSYDGYYVRVDGGPPFHYPTSEGTVSGLEPGSAYEVCATVNLTSSTHPDESDPSCVTATTASATPAPAPTATPTASPAPAPSPSGSSQPRGIWAEAHKVTDAELVQIKALGYDFVWSTAETASLDRVQAAGLKAAVWLGKWYDDNDADGTPCTWQKSAATVTGLVNAVKDHPAVAYYFVDDEPHDLCANVRSEFESRNALIKSIDGEHPTFITENRTEAFDTLANVTDVVAAIGYPCHWGAACSLDNVAGRIEALNAAGVDHYWSVPQLVEEPQACGGYYRAPSATEYATLMDQWRTTPGSRVEGEFAFMWNRVYPCAIGLSEHPELWAVVAAWNR